MCVSIYMIVYINIYIYIYIYIDIYWYIYTHIYIYIYTHTHTHTHTHFMHTHTLHMYSYTYPYKHKIFVNDFLVGCQLLVSVTHSYVQASLHTLIICIVENMYTSIRVENTIPHLYTEAYTHSCTDILTYPQYRSLL